MPPTTSCVTATACGTCLCLLAASAIFLLCCFTWPDCLDRHEPALFLCAAPTLGSAAGTPAGLPRLGAAGNRTQPGAGAPTSGRRARITAAQKAAHPCPRCAPDI